MIKTALTYILIFFIYTFPLNIFILFVRIVLNSNDLFKQIETVRYTFFIILALIFLLGIMDKEALFKIITDYFRDFKNLFNKF